MKHAQLVELYNRLTGISTELFEISGRSDYGYDYVTDALLSFIRASYEAVEKAKGEAYRLRTVSAVPQGPDEAPF